MSELQEGFRKFLWQKSEDAAGKNPDSAKMTIDIYAFLPSSPSRAVLMTAEALGVKLNFKEVNLFEGAHMKPDFIKMNPTHNIPVIDDNGFILNESRAIMMYLVNAYGKNDSLYPKPVKQRALVDQRLFFDATGLFRDFESAYYPAILGDKPINQDSVARLNEKLKILDEFLDRSKYAAGDTITIADFSIMSSLATIDASGTVELKEFKRLFAYFNKMKKEIKNYDELNDKGAKMFGELAKMKLQGQKS